MSKNIIYTSITSTSSWFLNVGKHIYDSKIINSTFDCKFINLNLSSSVGAIGKSHQKNITYFKIILKVFIFRYFLNQMQHTYILRINWVYKILLLFVLLNYLTTKYYCIFTTKEFQKCSINS